MNANLQCFKFFHISAHNSNECISDIHVLLHCNFFDCNLYRVNNV